MTRRPTTRRAFVEALVTLSLLIASLRISAMESYLIERRVTPAGYEAEAKFLELLKYAKPPEREFHAEDAPHWNVNVLMQFMPNDQVVFTDTNDSSRSEIKRSAVENSLKTRKGRAFEVFSHLSHIYSIPYRQYSELHFSSPAPSTSVVEVSNWYRLTFQITQQGPKLKQVDYLMLEGE